MKRVYWGLIVLFLPINLALAAPKTMVCTLQGFKDAISFVVPAKMGDLPSLDLSYPADVRVFSLRDANLVLVAMDHEDKSRLRLALSAQKKQKGAGYKGQFIMDSGETELQIDNGSLLCK